MDQLLVDDLDHLLAGVERAGQLGSARPLLDRGDEVLDHAQVDVSLEQRNPDLPRGGVDVGLGQTPLASQGLEGRRQAVLQGVEHGLVLECLRSVLGSAYLSPMVSRFCPRRLNQTSLTG